MQCRLFLYTKHNPPQIPMFHDLHIFSFVPLYFSGFIALNDIFIMRYKGLRPTVSTLSLKARWIRVVLIWFNFICAASLLKFFTKCRRWLSLFVFTNFSKAWAFKLMLQHIWHKHARRIVSDILDTFLGFIFLKLVRPILCSGYFCLYRW